MPYLSHIYTNIWNDPASYGPMHALGEALAVWPIHEEVDPDHWRNIIELGHTLEARHQHLEREAGRSVVSHDDDPQQPVWSFLNALLPVRIQDVDDGGATNAADHHRYQHPLMAVARYSGLAALSFVMGQGHMRPCSSFVNDQRHTFNVADVLGRRGVSGALNVLQKHETDPKSLGRQAMLWVGGAVGALQHEVLPEAKPWLDVTAYGRPPFASAMDKLLNLAFEKEVNVDQASFTLKALLDLAPWEQWRHKNSEGYVVAMTVNDWLYEVLNNGAEWAFDVWKKSHALPPSSTFDTWRAPWNPEDEDATTCQPWSLVQPWSLAARQRMIVEIEQSLLHDNFITNSLHSPSHPNVRHRL